MSERVKINCAWSALAFIWGSTYLTLRVSVLTFPPFFMSGVRFLIAGALMILVAWARGAQFPKGRQAYGMLAATTALLMLGGNGGVTWVSQIAPSGLVSLLASTSPLMIGFLSLFAAPSERLRPLGWLGLGLGIGGLALLLRPSSSPRILEIGVICGLAVLSWSLGSMLSRHRAPKCDSMAANGIQMLMASVVLIIIGLTMEPGLKQPLNWPAVLSVAYLTIIGSCVAFTLFFWLLSKIPASRVCTYAYVNPVVGVFLGWAVLHERLDAPMLAGAALTLAGVILANMGQVEVEEEEPVGPE